MLLCVLHVRASVASRFFFPCSCSTRTRLRGRAARSGSGTPTAKKAGNDPRTPWLTAGRGTQRWAGARATSASLNIIGVVATQTGNACVRQMPSYGVRNPPKTQRGQTGGAGDSDGPSDSYSPLWHAMQTALGHAGSSCNPPKTDR